MKQGNPVCDFESGVHIMGHHYLGDTCGFQSIDQLVDDAGRDGIETRGGLVVKHNFGMAYERPCESGSFAHSSRDLSWKFVSMLVKFHFTECVFHPLINFTFCKFVSFQKGECHVFCDGEPIQKCTILKQITDLTANCCQLVRRCFGEVLPEDFYSSTIRLHQANDVAQGDALARSRSAEEDQSFTFFNRDTEV